MGHGGKLPSGLENLSSSNTCAGSVRKQELGMAGGDSKEKPCEHLILFLLGFWRGSVTVLSLYSRSFSIGSPSLLVLCLPIGMSPFSLMERLF